MVDDRCGKAALGFSGAGASLNLLQEPGIGLPGQELQEFLAIDPSAQALFHQRGDVLALADQAPDNFHGQAGPDGRLD